jgi:hemoglobin-like flavoprotein
MTKRNKELVQQSFGLLGDAAGPLSLLFYGRLFELAPDVQPMFRGDIQRQGMKLMETLTVVVQALDRFESLMPVLHALGQRHTAYGVLPHHYGLVEEALLWALGQTLEVPSDSDVLAAWQQLLREVSTAMLTGASELHCVR